MNWLSALFDYLFKLWPFAKIQPWERGIRITYLPWEVRFKLSFPFYVLFPPEVRIVELGPGMHRAILWIDEIKKESVVDQPMDLLIQTVTTKDERQVTFSVNIQYIVVDVKSNILNVHNFEASMEAAARTHLAKRVRAFNWLKLLERQRWLEASLGKTLTTRAKRWGVEIQEVGFTDLAESKTYRVPGEGKTLIFGD